MQRTAPLIKAIEDAAARLGIAPSTVGERVGQGGRFYARLKAGKRVWPETEEKVMQRLEALTSAAQ